MVTLFEVHPPGRVRNPDARFAGGVMDGDRVGTCVVNEAGTIVFYDGSEYAESDDGSWVFVRNVGRVTRDRFGYPIGG